MEIENGEKLRMTEAESNTFIYTLEVISVALKYGWGIKIFRYDPQLNYLRDVLEDNDISPNVFFDLGEFCKENNVKSTYEWARAVQKKVFEEYSVEDIDRESFLKNLETIDAAYEYEKNPQDVLTKDELENFYLQCKEYIHIAYSTQFSSSATDL